MGLFCICWTSFIFVFHHVTFSAVNCQAPINVRAVYNPTGNITVTWDDPPGSQAASSYLVTYNTDAINRKDKFVNTKSYEFTPPVLGTTYTIEVFAQRTIGRSQRAVTRVLAATPVYSTEGGVASVTLNGATGTTWNVRHDSNTALILFEDTIQTNNLENTTTTVEILKDPLQVTLRFNRVVRENAGIYISKRRTGTQMLSSFVLTVRVKPSTPVISPLSAAVIESSVKLKCSSKSNSVPVGHGLTFSYSWRINDTDIQSGVKYGVNNDVLTIQKLEIIDRYNRYICFATEEGGLISDISFHIIDLFYGPQSVVLEPPRRNVTVEERDTISPITCTADCNPSCALQWKKKSQPSNTNVGSGAVLNLGSADRQEDGEYRCVAVGDIRFPENLRTRRSGYVIIDVKYAPSITRVQYSVNSKTIKALQVGQPIQVGERDELVITCATDADPDAEIELLDKEGKTLAEGLNTATLTADVKCEDTGKYVFQASNIYNRAPTRRDFIMNVYCQPREKYNAPKIFGGKRGEKIMFMTTVIAYPVPKATWDSSVTDNGVMPINDFTFNVSGYVDIQGEESYRNYSVTIGNTEGRDVVLKFVIRAEDVPDVSPDLSSILISDTSVALTWISPHNGGFEQKFTIEQRQTREQEWQRIVTDIVDNGKNLLHVYVVKNLKPDTSYQFKLYSRNEIGPSKETRITITTKGKCDCTIGWTAGFFVAVVVGLIAIVGNVILILKLKNRKGGNVLARVEDPNQFEQVETALSAMASASAAKQGGTATHYEVLKRQEIERPGVYDVLSDDTQQENHYEEPIVRNIKTPGVSEVLYDDVKEGPSNRNEADHYMKMTK